MTVQGGVAAGFARLVQAINVLAGRIPPGGAAGQVLTKTTSSDYALGWLTPAGGSNPNGTAAVDFGPAPGAFDASLVISVPSILASSQVFLSIASGGTPDHSEDEHLVEDIRLTPVAIVPGAGFTLRAAGGNGRLTGRWAVNWRVY